MPKSKLLLVALAVALSACETTAPGPQKSRIATAGGDLVFSATGFRFPRQVGAFVRAGAQQYDASGQDLSVKYQAGQLIVADVYEYPARNKTLAAEFADRKDEVRNWHSDARLLEESAVTIRPGKQAHTGRKAVFAVSTNYRYNFPPPYQSDVLVFQHRDRFIEYRFTYSAAHSERAEAEIAKFLDSLAWPGG